jgi:hypothetical protein
VDVDECLARNGMCDALTTCTNTPGSRTCGACPSGYSGTGVTTCRDVDECLTDNGGCDPVASCANTVGGRTCGACPAGYVGTGETACLWTDPSLSGLSVTPGALTFSAATTAYVVFVPAGTLSVRVSPTLPRPGGATVTVDGDPVASGASPEVPVPATRTTITVSVTATAGAVRVYTVLVIHSLGQQAFLKGPTTASWDLFGSSMAMSGDGSTLAVGAANQGSGRGRVSVFVRAGGAWTQQALLLASNAEAGDGFGRAALSADGNTLVVGAAGESSAATGVGGDQADNSAAESGAAYVFTRSGTSWVQTAYLKASNTGAHDYFGSSVALSADGSTLAVAAVEEASGALGVGGKQADDSMPWAGAVYVFARTATSWTQQAYVKALAPSPDRYFGMSVALSANGATLAVGGRTWVSSPDPGARGIIYVLTRVGSSWAHQGSLQGSAPTRYRSDPTALALSADGNTLAFSEAMLGGSGQGLGPGFVYVFDRAGAAWTEQVRQTAFNATSDDAFGSSVALSADGTTLAVGATGEDSAAVGVWGAPPTYRATDSGAAYVYGREGAAWRHLDYVKASNTGVGDEFGASVALSADGTTLAVGAWREASSATGVDGDQTDNSAPNSGAAYVFAR